MPAGLPTKSSRSLTQTLGRFSDARRSAPDSSRGPASSFRASAVTGRESILNAARPADVKRGTRHEICGCVRTCERSCRCAMNAIEVVDDATYNGAPTKVSSAKIDGGVKMIGATPCV